MLRMVFWFTDLRISILRLLCILIKELSYFLWRQSGGFCHDEDTKEGDAYFRDHPVERVSGSRQNSDTL